MALLRAALEIRHLAGVTRSQPRIEFRRAFHRAKCRDSDKIESKLESVCLDLPLETRALAHFRVAHLTYRSASVTDGIASGEPYAVSIRQRT